MEKYETEKINLNSETINFLSGDSVVAAQPLFQVEGQGSIPVSPLQLEIEEISIDEAVMLNEKWHSRLPKITNPNMGHSICFGAIFKNCFFASAIWTDPIARAYNGTGRLELRRFAISEYAPKNTATRMISLMTKTIKKRFPDISMLISYQDTSVHSGTIYKASGWEVGGQKRNIGKGWNTRRRNEMQSSSDKIRWEKRISQNPINFSNKSNLNSKQLEQISLF
tara:strand:- start:294 stop:965 length:672 start_codon:yes stop_codon:yes gene_type:complete